MRQEDENVRALEGDRTEDDESEVESEEQEALEETVAECAHEVREIARDLRTVLQRDIDHEQRLSAIEKSSMAEGKAAGKTSGLKWGAIFTLLAETILEVIKWLVNN